MGEGVRLSVTHTLYDPFFGTGKEGMMGDTLLLVGLNKNGLVVSVSPSTGGSFSLALTWHVPRGEELELRVCEVHKRTSSYPFLKKHNLLKTCYPLPTHHPSHPSMAIFPPFLTSPLDDRICLKHKCNTPPTMPTPLLYPWSVAQFVSWHPRLSPPLPPSRAPHSLSPHGC